MVAGDPTQHTPAGHGRICGHLAHRQRRLLKLSLLELRPRALKVSGAPGVPILNRIESNDGNKPLFGNIG